MQIFEFTPQPPEFRVRWDELVAAFDWLRVLESCPQDPRHHAEGNVAIHTRLVLEALARMPAWRALPATDRGTVFVAALLHDVAKPRTTREEADGSITARGHSLKGAIEARALLWRMGMPFEQREAIAAIIRHHQVPFFLIDRPDAQRLVIRMSQYLRCDWLALVAEADMRGRVAADQQRVLDAVELFREFCRDEACFDTPRAFATDLARFHYLQRGGTDPNYVPFDDTICEVVVMSGFPGAGKDWWIRRHLPEWPVVSLDELRAELDVDPADAQGRVVQAARERAREHLRRGEPFVWNATNVSRQLREQSIALCADYRARVRVVYLEVPEERLHRQNAERATAVPRAVIERLVEKWEPPDVGEAHRVEWHLRR